VAGLKGRQTAQGRKTTRTTGKKIKNLKYDEDTARLIAEFSEMAERRGNPELAIQIRAKGLEAFIDKNTGLIRPGLFSPVVGTALAAPVIGIDPVTATGTAIAREAYGTKLQQKIAEGVGKTGELIDQAKQLPIIKQMGDAVSFVGDKAKPLLKFGGRLIPVAGFMLTYNEAKAAGYSDEVAAGIALAGEASMGADAIFNPVEVAKGLEEQSVAKPIEARKQMAQNLGIEPIDPATRLQQQKRAAEALEIAADYDPIREAKSYDSVIMKASDEDLENIAQEFELSSSSAADNYARVIRNMSKMEPQKRAAITYGLQQQPAFRKLMEKTQKKNK
jgi:hypothetical protein